MEIKTIILLLVTSLIIFFIMYKYYQPILKDREILNNKLEQAEEKIKEFIAENAALNNSQIEKSKQITLFNKDIAALQNSLEKAQNHNHNLEIDTQIQRAHLKAEKDKIIELAEQFDKQKQALTDEFRTLSEKIMQERGKTLEEHNSKGIGALLMPLNEKLNQFQKRINELHDKTIEGNVNIQTEIKIVKDIGMQMSKEANDLTAALKGDSQKRGAWGEIQLERSLEMSGLVKGVHYEKQSSFRDAEDKIKRTDYIITLPDNKQIIIDSKVSLVAYSMASSAEHEKIYAVAMNDHIKSIKQHIQDLASKDYTNLVGVHSPSYVLMFMPIEPAYIAALQYDKDLFSYGWERKVVLVSHTTLMPILRTVANLWMLEQSNTEMRKVSEKAGEIYNAVCLVAERINQLGSSLNKAGSQYNDVVTSLTGQKGLQGKVERFTQLSTKISKTMPAVGKRHFECKTEQLEKQPSTEEKELSHSN